VAKKPGIHVVPNPDGGWNSKKEGASRASRHFDTQKDAIEAARETARRDKTELSIHGKDGRIREKDSYGNDPNPPKDKR
jgi:hypothetical protein